MLRRLRGARCLLSFVATAASLPACGGEADSGDPPSDVRVAVGRIEGTDAAIATLVDAQGAVAYVCGGPTTFESWTRWYHGSDDEGDADGEVALASADWLLEIDDSGLSGSVLEPSGVAHAWSATPASEGTGLFTAVDAGCRAGVVVSGEESIQGVWCDDLGRFAQVTPVLPIDTLRFDVTVALPEGIRILAVERARATSVLSP
jgi:hypothetical protein